MDYSAFHKEDVYYEYTRSYDKRYVAEIAHTALNKFRTIKDLNFEILHSKISNQFETWDTQYHRKIVSEQRESSKGTAESLTEEAKEIQTALSNILSSTLEVDDTVNWDSLKDFSRFKLDAPKKPQAPEEFEESSLKNLPPQPNEIHYAPNLNIFEQSFSFLAKNKVKKAEERYGHAFVKWQEECEIIQKYNNDLKSSHNETVKAYKRKLKAYEISLAEWEADKQSFYESQQKANELVDKLKEDYENLVPNSIIEYCEIVLNNSDYTQFNFPTDFQLEYVSENRTLLVDFTLPDLEDIPTLKEVKFSASRHEFNEVHHSDSARNKLYDEVIYQIIIRSVHELFEADAINAIGAIVFNGWVNTINKATGKLVNNCIASLHTIKEEFLQIDLARVDPKLCFKGLKGVGSSKLSTLTAINPIQKIDKSDKRFILSKDVADKLDEGSNLAAMDWEEFEHLVRELFHKEFSQNGGEVKVTQSSRDGGVDAIAFDPDPIRGGKIVIQAKRYTNTVGVNAVRDLWGTTMNEGATKGIIVTTSDYGSDAYSFAKDKPLTLLNGNNLLYLLEKHGYKAKIDIREARNLNS